MKILWSILLLTACSQAALGAEPAAGPLIKSALPTLPPNQEVVVQELSLRPGVAVPSHRHNAWVYVYIMAGTLDTQVAGGEVQHLTAGQVLTETPNDVHALMKNASTTETVHAISFMIKDAAAPGVVLTH